MKNLVLNFSVLCLLGIIAVTQINCSDDSDTTKPVIKLNQPTNNAILLIGDEEGFLLDVEFEDNEELSSYKVDIHNNFGDGHHHSRSEHDHDHDEQNAFSYNYSWPLSGKSQHVRHQEIKIPAGVTPGSYHLLVFCNDKAGNETYVAINIELEVMPRDYKGAR